MAFQPITEIAAQAPTRPQLLQRVDLACWCAVPDGYISLAATARRLHLALAAAVLNQDDRCHADVLLPVANGGRP